MLTQEEIQFNEARKEFDRIYAEIQEAIRVYRNSWSESYRERRGLTAEKFTRLNQFSRLVDFENIKRDVIQERSTARLSGSQKEHTDNAGGLVVSEERRNFLERISASIRKFFRSFNRRQENVQENEEIKEDAIETFSPIIEDDFIIEEPINLTEYGEKIFNVDRLIEEATRTYETLKVASAQLDTIYEKRINDQPKGKVIDQKRDGPGILDDYRQSSWGIERICLDGFQNHLPADSKGTQCYLHFKVGNRWVDCETAQKHRDEITEIRFSDNGVGFTADNLFYLHSTKTSEDSSAGQFGEGMKLASIAAVKLGLGLEFQSRNWSAIATSEEKTIINTRNNDEEESRKKLVYDVKVYDGEPIIGSRTIFHTPTPEFIDYALQLPTKIIQLSGMKPVFSYDGVDILDITHGGEAFVKGIYLTDIKSFFRYNFRDANVNPDRNGFHNFNWDNHIYETIARLDDPKLIEHFLQLLITYTEEKEIDINSNWLGWDHPTEYTGAYGVSQAFEDDSSRIEYISQFWKIAFENVVASRGLIDKAGNPKQPVLRTDYKIPEYLKSTLEEYAVIELPKSWVSAFKLLGIPTDRDVIPEYIEEQIVTSLSLDYGSEIWDSQRIVLDACQNHLPSDSKGSTIFLRFQTRDGKWHDYREFEKFEDSDIQKIKISDDGIGYDYKNLELFASVKDHDGSSGKWGEGLKMLSAAAIRTGVKMELRSRDWVAYPETKQETLNKGQVNEKTVDRLVYTVRKKIDPDSKILDDGEEKDRSDYGFSKKNEVSSTTFVEPTPELIKQFRNIRDSVLLFSPRTPIASTERSDVLSTSGGQLFVRNILIPGNHQLKYTYHLREFDIETRDRDVIKRESMQEEIREILQTAEEERLIGEFLLDAEAYARGSGRDDFLEFETRFEIPSDTELADKWISVFRSKFGERTSVRNINDLDFNSYHQAKHMGLEVVSFPDHVAEALIDLQGKQGEKIISYKEALENAIKNTIPVPEEELTEHERQILQHLYNYNKILTLDSETSETEPVKTIRIYDYPPDYTGEQAAGFASKGNEINISRRTLNNGLIEAGHVFFHEADHAITGAEDADKNFRDYLSRLLSTLALRIFPLEESVLDNGVAKDVSISDINKILGALASTLSKDQDDKTNTGEEFGEQ